ncbi:MAG: agmatinase [Candidatus Hadarchaeales archaeon]
MDFDHVVPVKPGFGGFDEPYESAEVVFVGTPLDVTSSYRSGSRFAPAKIREASANLETYLPFLKLDVFERLHISDIGDILVVPTDLTVTEERIVRVLRKILSSEKIPAVLGGEHTITYFCMKAVGDSFMLQLDAHRDLREEYMGDRLCHASVMRRILDFLPPERLIQVGIRSCSKEEDEAFRGDYPKVYTSEEVLTDPQAVAKEIEKEIGDSPLYLSLDLDVLDPACAPGVATPEPGGISSTDLFRMLRRLGKMNLRAFDIVELTPPHDNGITAFAAARAAYEILGAIASRKR